VPDLKPRFVMPGSVKPIKSNNQMTPTSGVDFIHIHYETRIKTKELNNYDIVHANTAH
jgi:hypothetical protein